ncbi:hypothetical protein PMALA_067240 [Plasmodium malariae]|uniref:Uncharacterized protein n=1 Tax=Plasmodium malariae TaxID=5858 RepID=A0A1A8X4I2_PLAMA|nr:hypothetical protein PMALA_067240 [Plasmodium malariae]
MTRYLTPSYNTYDRRICENAFIREELSMENGEKRLHQIKRKKKYQGEREKELLKKPKIYKFSDREISA